MQINALVKVVIIEAFSADGVSVAHREREAGAAESLREKSSVPVVDGLRQPSPARASQPPCSVSAGLIILA